MQHQCLLIISSLVQTISSQQWSPGYIEDGKPKFVNNRLDEALDDQIAQVTRIRKLNLKYHININFRRTDHLWWLMTEVIL